MLADDGLGEGFALVVLFAGIAAGADRVMDEPLKVHIVQFFPFRGATLSYSLISTTGRTGGMRKAP